MHTIKLTETGIELNGNRLSLPLLPTELVQHFSVPSREIAVHLRLPSGASEVRKIMICDESGVYCLQDESPPIIPELSVCLFPTEAPHSLRRAYQGSIHVGSLQLTSETMPNQLNALGALPFIEGFGNRWQFKNELITVFLSFCHPSAEGAPRSRHNHLSTVSISASK
jgi:hypothetical protein